ncbi:MICOS complex subunit mic25a-like [Carassius carassius]|uniref:MICOS complex subunit mic25a-like n=1 Tax=Carassius carassius TaxID=217509 RepID=UPI00286936C8|nr:MICOS complex subunit mic25a-like [Carassius carassius]
MQNANADPRPSINNKENLGQQTRLPAHLTRNLQRHKPGQLLLTLRGAQEEVQGPGPAREYEQQQAIIQEELAHIARKEREAARQDITRAVQRERVQMQQESEETKQLGKQLEKKETELKALEAFYKEQITQLEKKNEERFKTPAEQFHTAATRSEANIKQRNVDPVCSNLQAQILNCYRENREQTLQCSDLAKEYMQCISAAKKNLLVNHA